MVDYTLLWRRCGEIAESHVEDRYAVYAVLSAVSRDSRIALIDAATRSQRAILAHEAIFRTEDTCATSARLDRSWAGRRTRGRVIMRIADHLVNRSGDSWNICIVRDDRISVSTLTRSRPGKRRCRAAM